MAADEVLYEVADHVATISFNRPERRNAVTFDTGEQLCDALASASADVDVRAVVLTGVGTAFCAGDDVQAAWGDPRMEEITKQLASLRPPLTRNKA